MGWAGNTNVSEQVEGFGSEAYVVFVIQESPTPTACFMFKAPAPSAGFSVNDSDLCGDFLFFFRAPQSLVMSLSALRLRIVITYLQSQGLEPSMDDKEQDKRQCHIFITNALTVGRKEEHVYTYLRCNIC